MYVSREMPQMRLTATELHHMIQMPESDWLEFKQQLTDAIEFNQRKNQEQWVEARGELLKDLVALANTRIPNPLRYLIRGVDSNRRIVGINGKDWDDAVFQQWGESVFDPPLRFCYGTFELDGKWIGVFEVHRFDQAPHLARRDVGKTLREGQIWFRRGSKNTLADAHELRQYFQPPEPSLALGFPGKQELFSRLDTQTGVGNAIRAVNQEYRDKLTDAVGKLEQARNDYYDGKIPFDQNFTESFLQNLVRLNKSLSETPQSEQEEHVKVRYSEVKLVAPDEKCQRQILRLLDWFKVPVQEEWLYPKELYSNLALGHSRLDFWAVSGKGMSWYKQWLELHEAVLGYYSAVNAAKRDGLEIRLNLELHNLGAVAARDVKIEVSVEAPAALVEANTHEGKLWWRKTRVRLPEEFKLRNQQIAFASCDLLSPEENTSLVHLILSRPQADSTQLSFKITASNLSNAIRGALEIQ